MFITHDSDGRCIRIPAELAGKPRNLKWMDYCHKLWHAVHKTNGRDDIKITLHVKYTELEGIMQELENWHKIALKIDNGALKQEADRRLKNIEMHGITINCDAPEFI